MSGDIIKEWKVTADNTDNNCVRCKLLLCKVWQLSCGCYACETCANIMCEKSETCPGDTPDCTEVTRQSIRQDIGKTREMSQVSIRCPFVSKCEQMILVSNLHSHLSTCEYYPVTCKFCKQDIVRNELELHQQEQCYKKPTICKYCNISFPLQILKECHLNKRTPQCDKYIGSCPFCGCENLTKETMVSHSKSCSSWIEQCPFLSFGCSFEATKSDMVIHIKESARDHIIAMSPYVSEYGKLVSDMEHLLNQVTSLTHKDQSIRHSEELLPLSSYNNVSVQIDDSVLPNLSNGISAIKSQSWPDGMFIWKINKFRLRQEEARAGTNVCLFSEPFYSSRNLPTYKLRLILYPNGKNSGVGRSLAVNAQFMVGEYDDRVPWPFDSTLRIQILGKVSSEHVTHKLYQFTAATLGSYQRPQLSQESPFIGDDTFISLSDLENWYVHEDTIFITCKTIVS